MLIRTKNVSFPLKISRSAVAKSPPRIFENLARNSWVLQWVCMYACRLGSAGIYMSVSLRGMYVWEPRACMYACMSEGPQRVCMYVCTAVWGPPTPGIHLVWMYVCMPEDPELVCMYVWQTQASIYVCMSEAPEQVCMYVLLKATKSACFEGCQNPYQNPSKSDV